MSDQLVVKNYTWQDTTISREWHTWSRRDSNKNPSKPRPADTHLKPRSHWHWLQKIIWTFRNNLHGRTHIWRRSEQFIERKNDFYYMQFQIHTFYMRRKNNFCVLHENKTWFEIIIQYGCEGRNARRLTFSVRLLPLWKLAFILLKNCIYFKYI